MDNLAQVIGRHRLKSAWLTFLLSLSSCGPDVAPAPTKNVTESLVAPPTDPPPPDFEGIPAHPLADWTYADSLEELHDIWSERFALSATPNLDPATIWPYADAVQLDGASWGMAAETTQLIYIKPDGHAYQQMGAAHPKDASAAVVLTPEVLAAAGWATAQSSPELQRFEEGPGFRVAGPIRATQSCAACHAYAPEQIVALLVYDFQEIPDD